jgi:hypothetical protein
MVGEALGLSSAQAYVAGLGGFVHDLGKIGVPDQILHKPGPLTEAETVVMRTHPNIGRTVLAEHPLATLVVETVARHHERLDGKGYPERESAPGLAAFTRIVSVADALDAMTSNRPYRKSLGLDEALKRLGQGSTTQFDPVAVEAMTRLAHSGALEGIIGHSDEGLPLVSCPRCGPVIAISRNARDGDHVYCPVCMGEVRLHRAGNTFRTEPTQRNAVTLEPRPDFDQIQDIVRQAPHKLHI